MIGVADQRNDRELRRAGLTVLRRQPELRLTLQRGTDWIGLRQAEGRAQERLAIAPSELKIMGTKFFVEEAAETTEQTTGNRVALFGGAIRQLAVRRDQETAKIAGIQGRAELSRSEPGLVDQCRKQRPNDVHEFRAGLTLRQKSGRFGEWGDHDNGAVG